MGLWLSFTILILKMVMFLKFLSFNFCMVNTDKYNPYKKKKLFEILNTYKEYKGFLNLKTLGTAGLEDWTKLGLSFVFCKMDIMVGLAP